ncbi:hypothetical protein EI94DRAFT_1732496 [Lactarius quietus]|nr:hypothetical protein EI94DRAFT_1732496 [Lactarius quietus]
MDSPYHLQHYDTHTDHVTVVRPSSSTLLQPKNSLSPSVIGSDTESHTLVSNTRTSQNERLGSVSPFSMSMSSSPLSFYTANSSPSCSPALLWYSVKPELYSWASPFSTTSSPLSFYTANTTTSYFSARQAAASPTSVSSRVSSPYSVTSVNSYKSRKTVLYRRRAHPMTAIVSPVLPEYVVSLEVLTWEVRYLCTYLLPHMETRLEPAGMLLLQSLDLQRDLTQPVSVRAKEEFRYCSEVFIVLTREVLVKGAAGTRELKGPCKLLLDFRRYPVQVEEFLFIKPEALGLQSLVVAVELIRLTCVLRSLCSVMDAFEVVLNAISPPPVGDEDIRGDGLRVLHKISVSTGLTMGQYRKVLGQVLTQTQVQLESFPEQFGLSD